MSNGDYRTNNVRSTTKVKNVNRKKRLKGNVIA